MSLSVYIGGEKPRNNYSIINSFTPDHELIDDSYSSLIVHVYFCSTSDLLYLQENGQFAFLSEIIKSSEF
jgi:hypothetical protein